MLLGAKRKPARHLWPLAVPLVLSWLVFNWSQLRDRSAAPDGMRVLLQSHMERFEAMHAGVEDLPPWVSDSADEAEEVREVIGMAEADGIASSRLSVDLALVCFVLDEAFPGEGWDAEAGRFLFEVADPSESGYHPQVAALVYGKELGEGELSDLRYMLEHWQDDWWVVALAERFGLKPYAQRRAMLERGRAGAWRLLGLVASEVLIFGLAIASLWFVWQRFRRGAPAPRYSERMFALVPVPIALVTYGTVMWLLTIFAVVFVALSAAQFSSVDLYWVTMGVTIVVVSMEPLAMRLGMGLRKGNTARVFGWRGADLKRIGNWILAIGFACITLALITLVNVVLRWAGLSGGLVDVLPDGYDYSWGERVPDLIYGCAVAPVVEELVFRGMLYRVMRNAWGVWPAAIVSSLIFAFMHVYSAVGTVDTFVYGLLFCLVYQRTGSVAIAALTHAAVNTVIFAGAILMGW